MLRLRMPRLGMPLAALLLAGFAASGLGQSPNLAGRQETRGYSSGIGRISWTVPAQVDAIFAVPHWTAGARILCGGGKGKPGQEYECELQVHPRDLRVTEQQRLQQIEEVVTPMLPRAVDRTFNPKRTGPAEIESILDIVRNARAIDAREMWALRLGDYKAVCEERFDANRSANDAAFAASPFAAVDLVQFFRKQDASLTPESIRDMLAKARRGFGEALDQEPPESAQSFCEGFPASVAEAAKGI